MTILIKMKDELEAFQMGGSLKDFAGDLNIAAAQGKQFVVLAKPNGKPRMLTVHNVSWADEIGEEDDALFSG
jgi:hypothetical protein